MFTITAAQENMLLLTLVIGALAILTRIAVTIADDYEALEDGGDIQDAEVDDGVATDVAAGSVLLSWSTVLYGLQQDLWSTWIAQLVIVAMNFIESKSGPGVLYALITVSLPQPKA
jgi:hypothetical protein